MVQDDQQSGVSNASVNNFMIIAPGPEQVVIIQPHQPNMMAVQQQPQHLIPQEHIQQADQVVQAYYMEAVQEVQPQ